MTEFTLISKTDIASIKQFPATINTSRVDPYILEAQRFDLKEALGYGMYNALLNAYLNAPSGYSNENLFIAYGSLAVSTFQTGEVVRGKDGSDIEATGVVVSNSGGVLELSTLTNSLGTWDSAVTLLGATSGATAAISTLTYGKYYLLMNGESYVDPYNIQIYFQGLKQALCYWAFARIAQNNQTTFTDNGIVSKRNDYSDNSDAKIIAGLISQARAGASSAFNDVIKYMNDKNAVTITYSLWQSTCNSQKSGSPRFTTMDKERRRSSIPRSKDNMSTGTSSAGFTMIPITTLLDVLIYIVPALSGKTIRYVQYDNMVLTSSQWTLVGSTFTITDTDFASGVILAGHELIIGYE